MKKKYDPYNLNNLLAILSDDRLKVTREIYDYFSYIREGTWNTHTQKEKLEVLNRLEKMYYLDEACKACRRLMSLADGYDTYIVRY